MSDRASERDKKSSAFSSSSRCLSKKRFHGKGAKNKNRPKSTEFVRNRTESVGRDEPRVGRHGDCSAVCEVGGDEGVNAILAPNALVALIFAAWERTKRGLLDA